MSKRRWRQVDVAWRIVFTVLVTIALLQGREARQDQKEFSLANCMEIEKVKAGARAAAWRDFNNLDRNLRLLKLRRTQELVDAAKDARDVRLSQYRRDPCPRQQPERTNP